MTIICWSEKDIYGIKSNLIDIADKFFTHSEYENDLIVNCLPFEDIHIEFILTAQKAEENTDSVLLETLSFYSRNHKSFIYKEPGNYSECRWINTVGKPYMRKESLAPMEYESIFEYLNRYLTMRRLYCDQLWHRELSVAWASINKMIVKDSGAPDTSSITWSRPTSDENYINTEDDKVEDEETRCSYTITVEIDKPQHIKKVSKKVVKILDKLMNKGLVKKYTEGLDVKGI